jgi:hypothetical protein
LVKAVEPGVKATDAGADSFTIGDNDAASVCVVDPVLPNPQRIGRQIRARIRAPVLRDGVESECHMRMRRIALAKPSRKMRDGY